MPVRACLSAQKAARAAPLVAPESRFVQKLSVVVLIVAQVGRPPRRQDRSRDLDLGRVHRRGAQGRRARAAPARRRLAPPLGLGAVPEQAVRQRDRHPLACTERTFMYRFLSAEAFVGYFRTFYGPTVRAFETVGAAGAALSPSPRHGSRRSRSATRRAPRRRTTSVAGGARNHPLPASSQRVQRHTKSEMRKHHAALRGTSSTAVP